MDLEPVALHPSRPNWDRIIIVNLFARGSSILVVRLISSCFCVLLQCSRVYTVSTQDYDAFVMTPDGNASLVCLRALRYFANFYVTFKYASLPFPLSLSPSLS